MCIQTSPNNNTNMLWGLQTASLLCILISSVLSPLHIYMWYTAARGIAVWSPTAYYIDCLGLCA